MVGKRFITWPFSSRPPLSPRVLVAIVHQLVLHSQRADTARATLRSQRYNECCAIVASAATASTTTARAARGEIPKPAAPSEDGS